MVIRQNFVNVLEFKLTALVFNSTHALDALASERLHRWPIPARKHCKDQISKYCRTSFKTSYFPYKLMQRDVPHT